MTLDLDNPRRLNFLDGIRALASLYMARQTEQVEDILARPLGRGLSTGESSSDLRLEESIAGGKSKPERGDGFSSSDSESSPSSAARAQ